MTSDRPMTHLLQSEGKDDQAWFDEHGPRSMHGHVMRPIIERLNQAQAHTVLDLGCGEGWFTGALDRCGFEASGVDSDAERLAVARRQYPHMRFQVMDALQGLDSGLAQRFDAVVLVDVIDHVVRPRKLIESALDALKPGGLLVVTSPYYGYAKNVALALTGRFDKRWDPTLDDGRLKFFSRATLTAVLAEFSLHEVKFETIGRIPPLARAMMISATTPRST